MSDIKHTTGPWTHEGQGIVQHPHTGVPMITERIGTGGYGEIEIIDGTNESPANLDLIKAAPEMLEALEIIAKELEDQCIALGWASVKEYQNSCKEDDRWYGQALAAIRKAKGGQ